MANPSLTWSSPTIIILVIVILLLILIAVWVWDPVTVQSVQGAKSLPVQGVVQGASTTPIGPTLTPPTFPAPLNVNAVTFAVFNLSTVYQPADVNNAMAAIQNQAENDFGPQWGTGAEFVDGATVLVSNTVPVNVIPVFIVNTGTYIKQAIAYHSIQTGTKTDIALSVADIGIPSLYKVYAGNPYIVVYANNCQTIGSLSYPLSHEIMETIVDPMASVIASNLNINGQTTGYVWMECCDPLELGTSAQCSYTKMVNGAAFRVANFVFKAWFNSESQYRSSGGVPQYDFLSVFKKPFQTIGNPGMTALAALSKNVNALGRKAVATAPKGLGHRYIKVEVGKMWMESLAREQAAQV